MRKPPTTEMSAQDLTIRILEKATRIEINAAVYVLEAEFAQLRRQYLHATLQHAKDRERSKAQIQALRKSLGRCLKEAEAALDDGRGCSPEDQMDYDGWADEARATLKATATQE